MKALNTLLFSLTIATANVAIAHQSDPADKTQYQQSKITESLSMLSKKGGNIIVSQGEDGVLIIDNGYADLAEDLKTALINIDHHNTVKYIINTHWHFDHTGANNVLGKNSIIIAHDNVRKRLAEKSAIPLFKYKAEAHPKHALPSLTYPQAMRVHFNGDELQLEHFANSHTDGDTVVFFKNANLVHMGDLMFYPHFPFVDIHNGGNAVNYAANIKRINARIDDKTIVIPGHGSITDKQGLSKFQHMLESTIAEVKTMKDKGLSLTAAQEQGLNAQWQDWGKGFINEANWISFIYQSL
ncbi:MAG: glyoxylase-like metal-dependent hydrolase (beta-lactamase superfamily II) [Pseudohongiellaceae bacterium]|jgi:glyoxylase-like metal-dependent hydrolase (beta-lactamase superfamily II)